MFHRIAACLLFVIASTSPLAAAEPAGRFNVLMICVDDLRPTFGCYGRPEIKTPNIDKLAAGGTLFERAYVMQAVCSPSRTCLLTGRRPDTTKVYDLQTHFRKNLPDIVTLPQHFKNHGYHTQAVGKVYHSSLDDKPSWSAETYDPRNSPDVRGVVRPLPANRKKNDKTGRGPAWEAPDVADDQLGDGLSAKRAVELLNELKDKRFFLAVGFYKPHLPFVAPKKYFDLYPLNTIQLPKNPYPPKNAPDFALTSFGELRTYAGVPEKGPIGEDQARELIRAYHASTSYTDAQIGLVLDELESLGLDETTVVCLWGDHGWKLGEHGSWCKHTNFELDVNAPLIFRVPDQRRPDGESKALVEFVDVYPTLAELCGLPAPAGVEGTSLVPLIDDPDRPWKSAAFSQYPRGDVMGYSMRTDRYRYTEWQNKKSGEVEARELYDHESDPDENENVADDKANRDVVAKLGEQLKAGWQAALPK